MARVGLSIEIVLFFTLASVVSLFPSTFPLPEIGKTPRNIAADNNCLYISCQKGILVYSLKSHAFIRTIGKSGAGPGEFPVPPFIQVMDDRLFLHANDRALFYSKKGTLINQFKIPYTVFYINTVGKYFVVSRMEFENKKSYKVFNITNEKWESIYTLYKKENELHVGDLENRLKQFPVVPTIVNFSVRNNRIFFVDGHRGVFFGIYDANGKLIRQVNKTYPRVEINENKKNRLIDLLKQRLMPEQPGFWPFYLKVAGDPGKKIPRYYPAIYGFYVSNRYIFVKTYRFRPKDRKEEYIILDHGGKEVRRLFLPESLPRFVVFTDHEFICIKEHDEEGWFAMIAQFKL